MPEFVDLILVLLPFRVFCPLERPVYLIEVGGVEEVAGRVFEVDCLPL